MEAVRDMAFLFLGGLSASNSLTSQEDEEEEVSVEVLGDRHLQCQRRDLSCELGGLGTFV